MTRGRDAAALRDRDKRFSSAIFTWPSGRFLFLESLSRSRGKGSEFSHAAGKQTERADSAEGAGRLE